MNGLVLVFYESELQRSYFKSLKDNYKFRFEKFDSSEDPWEVAEKFVHSKAFVVLGTTDATSYLASLVTQKLGLIGPTPESIYKAQHKALFNQILLYINSAQPRTKILSGISDISSDISYPAFIRPAKGALSEISYRIESEEELRHILPILLNKRRRSVAWSDCFNNHHRKAHDPPLNSFIIQPFIDQKQYTVDGLVINKEVKFLGITETIYTPDRKSFARFDFPAELSGKVEENLQDLIARIAREIGYDNSGFNVEFFIDLESRITVIEFNTRLSIQFVPLMEQWYEQSNLDYQIQIGLGKQVQIVEKENKLHASSCVLRVYQDKKVIRVPAESEVDELIKEGFAVEIKLLAEPGKLLSDYKQDAYTFRYALIDIAGKNLGEILEKLEYCKNNLAFEFKNVT